MKGLISALPDTPALTELALRTLARKSYFHYLSYCSGPAFRETAFSRFLSGRIETFIKEKTGNAYDILVIAAPPQHGKSMTVSEALPAWFLLNNPDKRVILASYNEESAQRFCRRNAEKVREFALKLGGVPMGALDRASEFELLGGKGRMISRGIMSGITGNPADLIIIDDPIKNREEADSQAIREKLWGEWQNSLKSRLAAGGKVIIIMTPWHEDDLRGRVLKTEKNASYLCLPLEAGENDPMGRKKGSPLCPELGKDENWLRDFKEGYIGDPLGGMRAWQALYMCAPRTEEGNFVLRRYWQYYDILPDYFGDVVLSLDAAFKGGEASDFCALSVWGTCEGRFYLLYLLNDRLSFSRTLEAVRMTARMFPRHSAVLIEEAANGAALIDSLRSELNVIPVIPRESKTQRLRFVSPAIEAGRVLLPRTAPFTEDLVEQFSAFPNGKHDDMVDSCTQALRYLLTRPRLPEIHSF